MVFSNFLRPTDVAATWWFCCISCSLLLLQLLLLDFLLLGQRLQHIIAVAAWSAIVTLLLTSTNCFPHTPTPPHPLNPMKKKQYDAQAINYCCCSCACQWSANVHFV
jgi:hypothetical protein